MATAYSAEIQCSTYVLGRVRVEYSGTSGTAYYEYRHTYGGYTGYGGTFSYNITGGTQQSRTWTNETISTTWTAKFSQPVSINLAGETKSFWVSGYSFNQMSGSVKIDAQIVAPSGLSVTVNSVGQDKAVLSGSISSYGQPIANTAYMEVALNANNAYGNPYRVYKSAAKATSLSNITISNSSSTGSTTLNLRPNTKYYPGVYANNGYTQVSKMGDPIITLPASFTNITTTNDNTRVDVTFTRGAEGSDSTVRTYYSLNNSTWTECKSPFSFNREDSGTYTLYMKATNSTGTVTGTATYKVEASNVYIGDANGEARKITKMYIGDENGTARQIYKLYIGDEDGTARKVIG